MASVSVAQLGVPYTVLYCAGKAFTTAPPILYFLLYCSRVIAVKNGYEQEVEY